MESAAMIHNLQIAGQGGLKLLGPNYGWVDLMAFLMLPYGSLLMARYYGSLWLATHGS